MIGKVRLGQTHLPCWIAAGDLRDLDFPSSSGRGGGGECEGEGGGVGCNVSNVDINC
jgi:hypothetical protein